MGKLPFLYTDSDETEETSSSIENVKKKKKFSILKCSNGNIKKKKCKLHSKSEPDDSDYRSRSLSGSRSGSRSSRGGTNRVKQKLRGILKTDKEKDYSTDDDEDSDSCKTLKSKDRCLVGRVPRPVGAKPGRGGGVAIIVRRNVSNLQPKESTTSNSKRRQMKRLARKKSY